ncbi:helix-turn-helix transcriptional regulator [Actinocorallia sp. A-T 12471]|uniref:helix-turn-helix domain-containing protein n=1 Tax=Actinocorallia sp. A-T 12471 TaxID=3089813 RepID=UPI0029D1FF28|nr:helix-turn-helix transcriptional regulator [Actinocorallia sp. A-T 12471]MDX6742833.1 helix-turn-helix transcriptional regulator [Actinocorallia sp. A-T 12471]
MNERNSPPANAPFGDRLRHYRDRLGMTRPVLGGLVGRSPDWVKDVEGGRLQQPRLPMLQRLAHVLNVGLDDLVGGPVPIASYTKGAHGSLSSVTDALTDYPIDTGDITPLTSAELAGRASAAWQLWHGSARQRTAVAVVLPDLIRQGRLAARLHDGRERRAAHRELARIYHLVQLYLAFQPVPEMVLLAGDRAMTAAQDSDDPHAIAVAAWYMNHIFRNSGERDAARIDLSQRAMKLLDPERGGEDLARWGLLQLACALSHAKSGREGDALRHWDEAHRAARGLGRAYAHPWLVFGTSMVDAYAVTIQADLTHGGTASRLADRLDLDALPSATRRSFHLTESARAYLMRREPVAAVALLRQAETASPETLKFSPWARSAILELSETGTPATRRDAAALRSSLGLEAA